MKALSEIKELNSRAWDCRNSDLDRAIVLCGEARDLLRDHPHRGEYARCLTVLARCHYKKGDLVRGDQYACEGLETIPGEDYEYLRPHLYGVLSSINWHRGDMALAGDYCSEEIAWARKRGDRRIEAKALDNLALIRFDRENMVPAVELFEKSLSLHREVGNHEGILHVINNLVMCHLEQRDPRRAVEIGQEALALIESEQVEPIYYVSLFDSLGLCYMELGDYTRASDYFRRTLELMDKLGMAAARAVTLFHMGRLYHRQGETDTALFWMQEAMGMIKKHDNYRKLKECHLTMAELYDQKGDGDNALYHRREAEMLTD